MGWKSGAPISRPHEPRWMGLEAGSLEKYLYETSEKKIIMCVVEKEIGLRRDSGID